MSAQVSVGMHFSLYTGVCGIQGEGRVCTLCACSVSVPVGVCVENVHIGMNVELSRCTSYILCVNVHLLCRTLFLSVKVGQGIKLVCM